MNKSLLFSLLLVSALSLNAMEQDGNGRDLKRPGEEIEEGTQNKQKSEIKSLVDCCKQFMKRVRKSEDIRSARADIQDMEKILKLDLPLDVTCYVLANVHQSVFDKYSIKLGELLTAECNNGVKAIIAQRLPNIDQYAHLTDEFIKWIHDDQVSLHVKCALIERIPALQTIELIETIAEQGPITQEVANIFCRLLLKTKCECLFIQILEGTLLSENARAHGNELRFAKAMQDYLEIAMPRFNWGLNLHDIVDQYRILMFTTISYSIVFPDQDGDYPSDQEQDDELNG